MDDYPGDLVVVIDQPPVRVDILGPTHSSLKGVKNVFETVIDVMESKHLVGHPKFDLDAESIVRRVGDLREAHFADDSLVDFFAPFVAGRPVRRKRHP